MKNVSETGQIHYVGIRRPKRSYVAQLASYILTKCGVQYNTSLVVNFSGLGIRAGIARRNLAADLPGPVLAQLCNARRSRPAYGPHHGYASRAARTSARAQLTWYVHTRNTY